MLASSSLAVFFAAISIVSAFTLAYIVLTQEKKVYDPHGPVAFHRHLEALSDISRQKTRSQAREMQDPTGNSK